jgi:hypothetical protein
MVNNCPNCSETTPFYGEQLSQLFLAPKQTTFHI